MSGSRDHARTPMQWNNTKNAGFTNGTPWIGTDEDYLEWNVEKQLQEENSVLRFYKELIQIRKKNLTLVYGDFIIINRKRKNIFTYYRRLEGKEFLIECNLSDTAINYPEPSSEYKLLLSGYENCTNQLRPYEARLYERIK
jgi:oligo-1,6-glucosidase